MSAPLAHPEGLAFAKLSVALARAIPAGEDALRTWWTKVGGDAHGALALTPAPSVTVRGHRFELLHGSGALDGFVDARLAPPGAVLGAGYLGFWDGVAPLGAERAAGAPNPWGLGPSGSARPLLGLVAALARREAEVRGVVLGRAGSLWMPAAQWLQRVGNSEDPARLPMDALLDVAFAPSQGGVLRLRSFGMRATLALPDVELDDALAIDDDARQLLGERALWAACRRLAGQDARRAARPEEALPPGQIVQLPLAQGAVAVRVVGFTDAQRHTLRLAELAAVDD